MIISKKLRFWAIPLSGRDYGGAIRLEHSSITRVDPTSDVHTFFNQGSFLMSVELIDINKLTWSVFW